MLIFLRKKSVFCKKEPLGTLITGYSYQKKVNMNGDGINFDQSDLENEEAFEEMRKHLKKIRKEFSEGKRDSNYGSSKFLKK